MKTDQLAREIEQLAQDDQERMALETFVREHPDIVNKDTMMAYLGGRRWAQRRAHALTIQLRHQFLNATPEDIQILVHSQLDREEAQLLQSMQTLQMPLMPMNCISRDVGGTVYTSCY